MTNQPISLNINGKEIAETIHKLGDMILNELGKKDTDLIDQRIDSGINLSHCAKCHACVAPKGVKISDTQPIAIAKIALSCKCCKHEHKRKIYKSQLPSEENGILCKCKHPDCGLEFYAKKEWLAEQEKRKNVWMPVRRDK